METVFRNLPSVERLLTDPRLEESIKSYSREAVADAVRIQLSKARSDIKRGKSAPSKETLLESIASLSQTSYTSSLKPVVNATGVIIHTNIGRAPLSTDAIEAAHATSAGYSNLELDLDSGGRGSRHVHVENLLRRLTGAQAAIAVNNNASALLLGLMTLANAGEVIISRGEAVEIGGGFRIPDVLEQSGATLIEVGTTNRTYASDYNSAINSNTAALLKVHTSNFKVSGFVHTPTLAEMMQLGTRHKIPVLHDIGSGCLLETTAYGMTHEPTPQESVRAGVDLSFFSGDKLLGGPQSGIIVGKKKYVDRLKASPLARAVRLDKMTLAALTATLLHYITGQAKTKIPVWQMISADLKTLESRVKKWIPYAGEQACIVDSVSTIGGGSLPGEYLPSKVLAIKDTGAQLNKLARRLRKGTPAVLARIDGEMLLIDPRTVLPNQDQIVAGAIRDALGTS